MSLIHDTIVTLPNNPAYEVSKNPWNAEHTFPGAGAGEVVYVDASNHAATSADFKFDAGTKTLTVGAGGLQDSVLVVDGQIKGLLGLTIKSDPSEGSILSLGADGTVGLAKSGGIGFSVDTENTIGLANDAGNFGLQGAAASAFAGSLLWDGVPLIPGTDNALDFGGVIATVGTNQRIRTGYFGTSVVTPIVAGVGSNISITADLDITQAFLTIGDSATVGDRTFQLKAGNASIFGHGDGSMEMQGAGGGLAVAAAGGVTFDVSADAPAYLVSGAPGIDATVTTADLVGKTLTFVKGICTGYA